MTELFTVSTPPEASARLAQHFHPIIQTERIATWQALDRIVAEPLLAPHHLPEFRRSTVDGYAVHADDTFGASPGLPALLDVIGEAAMGQPVEIPMGSGQAVLVHTGSLLPPTATAVVMVEQTQPVDAASIEVMKPVADGENVLQVGEDVRLGDLLLRPGHRLRPQDIGGLVALGITTVQVAVPPRVAIISSGDEVIPPDQTPLPGQVRDVNSYALAAMVQRAGGLPVRYGIVLDERDALAAVAMRAKAECAVVLFSAGSSVSYRDMTAQVIAELGEPGVLVHGVSVKPGKPTILAVCDGKAVFGLPGNPVSAMVIFDLFVAPTIQRLLGATAQRQPSVQAKLARNLASVTGREDYVQVKLEERNGQLWATPVLGKSNLIYTLVQADGVVRVPLDVSGITKDSWIEVRLY